MIDGGDARGILAIGGAHVDRRGRLFAPAVPGASNPGRWHEEAGGGALNAARGLSRLGHRVRLVAPRGGDAAGDLVAAAVAEAGIEDTPLTFLDRSTPSYTAILDSDGSLVVALADMALYDVCGPRQIARRTMRDAIQASDAVLCDANLPEATLLALARACAQKERPLFAIAVSPAKVPRLRPALAFLAGIFMNEAELCALTGCAVGDIPDGIDRLASAGVGRGVVTCGAAPAVAFDGTRRCRVLPPEVPEIGDVTGAGDALAAGFADATLRGLPLEDALRSGVAAACIAVASIDAAPAHFDRAALATALSLVPGAEFLA